MEGRGKWEGKGEVWSIDTLRINVYMLVIIVVLLRRFERAAYVAQEVRAF